MIPNSISNAAEPDGQLIGSIEIGAIQETAIKVKTREPEMSERSTEIYDRARKIYLRARKNYRHRAVSIF